MAKKDTLAEYFEEISPAAQDELRRELDSEEASKKQVSLRLDGTTVSIFDRVAAYTGVPRAQILQTILQRASMAAVEQYGVSEILGPISEKDSNGVNVVGGRITDKEARDAGLVEVS